MDGLKKRLVPERLNLALEVCFQRDNITPHVWSRELDPQVENDKSMLPLWYFGQLYCATYLSDEEWNLYLKYAVCELKRSLSSDPGTPLVLESESDDEKVSDEILKKHEEIQRRLGSNCECILQDVFDETIFTK